MTKAEVTQVLAMLLSVVEEADAESCWCVDLPHEADCSFTRLKRALQRRIAAAVDAQCDPHCNCNDCMQEHMEQELPYDAP